MFPGEPILQHGTHFISFSLRTTNKINDEKQYFTQVVIGTKVGRAKHMRIMPGGALETDQSLSGPSSMFVGKKLDEHRGSFILEYPMDKGHIVDGGWDAMESLWDVRQHTYII